MRAWPVLSCLVLAMLLSGCAPRPDGTPPALETADDSPVAEADLVPRASDGYTVTLSGSIGGPSALPAWMSAVVKPTITFRVRDGRGRIDYGRFGPPTLPEGGYVLVDARAGHTTLVQPERQEASRRSAAAGIDTTSSPHLEVTDTTSRVEELGAGATILGIPTRKVRVSFAYSLQAPGAVNPPRWRTEVSVTYHISDRITALDPAFARYAELTTGNALLRGSSINLPAVEALTRRAPSGFALLQEHDGRVITGNDTTRAVNAWRVTRFQRGGVRAADLQVPDGFTLVEATASQQATRAP